jgi:tRNA-specific 2-thiouridylase
MIIRRFLPEARRSQARSGWRFPASGRGDPGSDSTFVMRILVGMSGGVDSSVAALLLKRQGFEVAGAYMKNWINEDEIVGECPWQQDIEDARASAERVGIPFEVVNLMQDYRAKIVDYLLDGYRHGLTPNPDVMCNREIKFGVFLRWARDHRFDAVATGHYARRVEVAKTRTWVGPAPTLAVANREDGRPGGPSQPRFALFEGADKNKDQSYFLALLDQEQLAAALFPLGELTKPQVRALAREAGLPNAGKKDSQGICFIGNVRMQDFLRAYVPDAPGPIVRATDGKVLGEHRGLHLFTLGQRKGIGIPSNTDFEAYVVVAKRAADNALLVAFDGPQAPGLFTTAVRVHLLSWIGEPVTVAGDLEGRVRYRDPRVPLRLEPQPDGTATVTFRDPQRGLAPGQILALHDGERLLGGGIYG